MRATCTIIGVGKRMKGVSANTQRPYDFQAVSFSFPDDYYTGEKATTCNVQGDELDSVGGICVGDRIEVVMHRDNDKYFIDGILRKA